MFNIKKTIIKLLNKHQAKKTFIYTVYKWYRYKKNIFSTFVFFVKGLFLSCFMKKRKSVGKNVRDVLTQAKIKLDDKMHFCYSIDYNRLLYTNKYVIENTTIDYSIILENSLDDFAKKINEIEDSKFKSEELLVLEGIYNILDREIKKIEKSKILNKEEIIQYLKNIKFKKAVGFEEALQRILFFNQLLWQTGHNLMGLGKLDEILYPYYKNDLKNKSINKNNAEKLISEFLKTLHSFYWLKSSALLGDTGQIIILGGIDSKNKYCANDLTYMFIEQIKQLQIPDPKVLLRVSSNIPGDLMNLSIDCIKTGIGCPLFANDDIIIPKLIDFGYSKDDSYNYVTSACWEPLIPKKSLEQNNMLSMVFMQPFNEMLDNENVDKINDTEQLIEVYSKYLLNYTKEFLKRLDDREYEQDPLMSLFVPNCYKKLLDITDGGAKYNNYGVTTVSLANVVNSILNIEQLVFREKKYTLSELNLARKDNFVDSKNILADLKKQSIRYGKDDTHVVEITNKITSIVNKFLVNYKNKLGGRIKIGLSAPTYIIESKNATASLDGRKNGEPFIVHISSDIPQLSYTELINFSSQLDYSGNRFNGNVVDFMVTPSFINDNYEKFTKFIMLSINVGFFEMQMNVVSSDVLIKAKNDPKAFPNLIVRVWGFSAYFNDLPNEYKDVLIERALKNEGKSY